MSLFLTKKRITFVNVACLIILAFFVIMAIGDSNSQVSSTKKDSPRQILVNPDFSLPLDKSGNPPGWFQAMIPNNTIGLKAGIFKDAEGPYLFLEQQGVKGMLFNNWAQRIENPPIGARVRLEALVSTQNAKGNGAAVMVMFFSRSGSILGEASSEGKINLTGTKPWTKIELDGKVPTGCTTAIVRLGLSSNAGKLKVRYAKLYLLDEGIPQQSAVVPLEARSWTAGLELLTNGDFEELVSEDSPSAWFKAMVPQQAIDHKAGIEELPNHGKVAYIKQRGTRVSLVNNWAQRLEVIPVGARLKLTAEVKTADVPENTGVVMIQCWDTKSSSEGKLLAAATSQSSQPIGGTRDWTKVSMEVTVPQNTDAITVRCGMYQSGMIWFDNVSLKIVSPPPANTGSGQQVKGFKVTAESMQQLETIKNLSEKLIQLSKKELDKDIEIRKEIYALGDEKFEIVLFFSFSNPD